MASFKVSRGLSLKRLAGAGMLAMVMSVGLHSGTALAHAMLVKAEPARRAALTKAPAQVRLWFNEEIEKDYPSISLLKADKTPIIDKVKPEVAADDPKSIVLPLPELEAGKYTVEYRVLSVDGHVVDSSYDFTVKSKAPQK